MNASTPTRIPKLIVCIVIALCLALACAVMLPVGHAFAAQPAKPTISSVTSCNAGTVKIAVKKAKDAKGYQYWASTSKSFDKTSRHDIESLKVKKTIATLSGLKEGKTYYVKVRAYAGKTYGKWSSAKKVKVKSSPNTTNQTETENAQLKSENSALALEISQLKSANANLTSEVTQLTSENSDLASEIAQLRSENESLRAEVARLESELNSGSGPTGGQTGDGALKIVTGGEAGTWYALGVIIAQHATNNAGLSVTALSSNGAVNNIALLSKGTAQLGFCQSDIFAYAYQSSDRWTGFASGTGSAVTKISTVAALYDEQAQIITCNPDIRTVADLMGKRVSIGVPGSGVYYNAIDILGAYGISEEDITPIYQSFYDSVEALKDGNIDAAFIVAAAPTAAVADLSTSRNAYLVGMDEAHVSSLVSSCPYYTLAIIPAGTYRNQEDDVLGVAIRSTLVARNDIPEDDVYALVKDIFDNAPLLTSSNDRFKEINLEKGASNTTVPYHPGAARYFAEKGYTVSEVAVSTDATTC